MNITSEKDAQYLRSLDNAPLVEHLWKAPIDLFVGNFNNFKDHVVAYFRKVINISPNTKISEQYIRGDKKLYFINIIMLFVVLPLMFAGSVYYYQSTHSVVSIIIMIINLVIYSLSTVISHFVEITSSDLAKEDMKINYLQYQLKHLLFGHNKRLIGNKQYIMQDYLETTSISEEIWYGIKELNYKRFINAFKQLLFIFPSNRTVDRLMINMPTNVFVYYSRLLMFPAIWILFKLIPNSVFATNPAIWISFAILYKLIFIRILFVPSYSVIQHKKVKDNLSSLYNDMNYNLINR